MNSEPENGASPEPKVEVSAKERRTSVNPIDRVNGKASPRWGIVVEGEVANAAGDREKNGDQAESNPPTEEGGLVLIPTPSTNGDIITFPTKAQFDLIIAQADTPEKLVRLRNMVAARNAAAKHMRANIEQLVQFAALQLRVDRTIGQELAQHVRAGPVARLYSGSTITEDEPKSTLPEGVSRNQSSDYQELAAAPDEVFEEFLALAVKKNKPPTVKGALRYAAKASGKVPAKPRKAKKPKAESAGLVLSSTMLDCVQRILGQIDVCVGDAKVKCRLTLKPDTFQPKELRGTVFVSDCQYPAAWLPKFAKLRRSAGVDEVLVTLPAETASAWFKDLMEGEDEWACCFPTDVLPPLMLAYLGRREGFKAVCAEIGPVVRGL